MPDLTELNQRLSDELENIGAQADQPYISNADFDRLIRVVQVMLCNHEWETRWAVATKADSTESAVVCKCCGAEV